MPLYFSMIKWSMVDLVVPILITGNPVIPQNVVLMRLAVAKAGSDEKQS